MPRKRFGQHWLRSESTLNKIIAAAELKRSDRVLEIGPGKGVLTKRLLAEIDALTVVEIDRDLCKQLVKNFGKEDNFLLLEGDFLALDIDETIRQFPKFQNHNKIVANIPYNITAPILEKILGTIANPNPNPYESIVLLVQKEVAERLVAQPNSKAFGAFSVRVQYLAKCEIICEVPAKAFYPPPKVDSAVIKISPYQEIPNPAQAPRHLESLIKMGFSSRRKMLRNNLKSLIEPDKLNQLLIQLDVNPQARAENLSLLNWIGLSNLLDKY